ncbi:Hypothetical_protein [Hexamita inflata]|uniref:Hypothetical_protein n=1 Tax=Hexamita inflata TaxID=28002 RepID=A0AA86R718_9EUKA|nr:Hypothetical protein HINF_LOCUS3896 [Hexamita inflata]CAI9972869.1 Hypothetical protein HINF_LOCUS60514 [Hexamita inflata]
MNQLNRQIYLFHSFGGARRKLRPETARKGAQKAQVVAKIFISNEYHAKYIYKHVCSTGPTASQLLASRLRSCAQTIHRQSQCTICTPGRSSSAEPTGTSSSSELSCIGGVGFKQRQPGEDARSFFYSTAANGPGNMAPSAFQLLTPDRGAPFSWTNFFPPFSHFSFLKRYRKSVVHWKDIYRHFEIKQQNSVLSC